MNEPFLIIPNIATTIFYDCLYSTLHKTLGCNVHGKIMHKIIKKIIQPPVDNGKSSFINIFFLAVNTHGIN